MSTDQPADESLHVVLDNILHSLPKYRRLLVFHLIGIASWAAWCYYNFNYVFTGKDPRQTTCLEVIDNGTSYFWSKERIEAHRSNQSLSNSTEGVSEFCKPWGLVHDDKLGVVLTTTNESTLSCHQWDYDIDGASLKTDFHLMCHTGSVELSQSMLGVGVLLGALIWPYFADRFGRRPFVIAGSFGMAICGSICALAPNMAIFDIGRFFIGFVVPSSIQVSITLWSELYPASSRVFALTVSEAFWVIPMCTLPLLAYLVPNWRVFTWIQHGFFAAYSFLLIWLLPESLVWLITNGKYAEAKRVLKQYYNVSDEANLERLMQSQRLLEASIIDEQQRAHAEQSNRLLQTPTEKADMSGEIVLTVQSEKNKLRMFLAPSTFLYACLIFTEWFVNVLLYGSLTYSVSMLPGSIYLNFLLSALIESPAYVSSYFLARIYGRKRPTIGYLSIALVCLILSIFLPADCPGWALILVTTVCKFGITGSFAVLIVWSPEVFPTNIRAMGQGFSATIGRLSGIVSPYYTTLGKYVPFLPPLLGSGLAVAGIVAAMFLPETNGLPLPTTSEDVDEMRRARQKRGLF